MSIPYGDILIILMLILLNGVFAMSELAIVSSKKVHLRRLAEDGSPAAARALAFAENPGLFLPTVQVGITLISILAGAFGGATLAEYLAPVLEASFNLTVTQAEGIAVFVIVVAVTYLTLIVGELVPKELALRHPERFALFVATPLHYLSRFSFPVVWVLNKSSRGVLRLLGVGDRPGSTVTEEEVRALLDEGTEYGLFEQAERDMISGVMLLADKPVRAFMTPRIDIVSVRADALLADIRTTLGAHDYSRFPVFDPATQDFTGVIQTKDILQRLLDGQPFDLPQLVREIESFPETTQTLKVIERLNHAAVHIAFVVDEHGSIEGIVTMSDLIAAVTGAHEDSGSLDPDMVRREDGSWLVDGSVLIDRVCDEISLRPRPAARGYHTLAGFILNELGRVPASGDHFIYGAFRFEVVDMDGLRIDKVLISAQNTGA